MIKKLNVNNIDITIEVRKKVGVIFLIMMSLIPRRTPMGNPEPQIDLMGITLADCGVQMNVRRQAYAWFEATISSKEFGALLGPRGHRLSEIRSRSGCAIRVCDAAPDGTHLVIIRHKTSQQNVDTALILIAITISVFSKPDTGHLSLMQAIVIIKSEYF